MTDQNNMITRILNNGPLLLGWVFVVLIVAFYPNMSGIAVEWMSNGPYSHGFLALAIVGWIFYQERHLLRPAHTHYLWLAFLVLGGMGWWVADVVNVQFIQNLALVGMLYCAALFLFGLDACLRLKIPLLSLLLILPVWNFLQIPLQEISSDVTFVVLNFFDIPVFREGFRFSVPGGQFIVEEACSGLGFFLTSILLAVLFCYYNQVSGIRQLYFVAFAVGLSMLSNWIRIIIIMIVGNYTQMDHFIVEDHLTFGWIVFSLTLIPFFYVGHRLAERAPDQSQSHVDDHQAKVPALSATKFAALTITLVAFPVIAFVESRMTKDSVNDDQVLSVIRQELNIQPSSSPNWKPFFAGASSISIEHYSTPEQRKLLGMVVRYDRQKQGSELIYVNNEIYDEDAWIENTHTTIKTDSDVGVRLLSIKDRRGNFRTIAYWYVIGGIQTVSPVKAKALELAGALRGDRSAYLVAFALDSDSYSRRAAEIALLETTSALQVALAREEGQVLTML